MKQRLHPADIGARIVSAVGGGYLLTLLAARAAAQTLPMGGAEAAIAASLGAWLVFLGVVVWTFAARTAVRAVAPVGLAIAMMLAVAA